MDLPPKVEIHSFEECHPCSSDHIVITDGYYYQSGDFISYDGYNVFIPDEYGPWQDKYWFSTGRIHPKFLEVE